jgi:hypothetical protein
VADVYDLATARFNAYAGMDAPELPEDSLSAIQVRLHRWQVQNFGWQPSWTMVLGITEEVSELVDAPDADKLTDAVGDIMVFSTQLCTDSRLDFGTLLRNTEGVLEKCGPLRGLNSTVGWLSHVALKTSQRVRGFDDPVKGHCAYAQHLQRLLINVRQFSQIDIERAYVDVAEHVMKRDWRQDPSGRSAT